MSNKEFLRRTRHWYERNNAPVGHAFHACRHAYNACPTLELAFCLSQWVKNVKIAGSETTWQFLGVSFDLRDSHASVRIGPQ